MSIFTKVTMLFIVFLQVVLFTGIKSSMTATPSDKLVLELATNHVDITTDFTGDYLTVFGMIKSEAKNKSSDSRPVLAIVLKGPDKKAIVRRKENIYGMWINKSSFEFLDVPSYYDYAISRAGYAGNLNIGLNSMDFTSTGGNQEKELSIFKEALIANAITKGLYAVSEGKIKFISGGLFRAGFEIPSGVPAGTYQITAYLFENGKLIESEQATLTIAQTGFSADLYNFAYDDALLYGLLSVLLAVIAGFLTNLIFKKD